MTELDQAIVDLVHRHRLDQIMAVSKDDLDVQARHFQGALADYASASRRALESGNLTKSDEAANRYHLVATLYAPGLIGALASSLLRLAGDR